MKELHLSDGEWVIMQVLWKAAPKTIMQITAELKQVTGWSKHTVITMLRRLETKGAVNFNKNDKAKLYFPTAEKDKLIAWETEKFLKKVYENDWKLMLKKLQEGGEN